jgi:hypothetical protein
VSRADEVGYARPAVRRALRVGQRQLQTSRRSFCLDSLKSPSRIASLDFVRNVTPLCLLHVACCLGGTPLEPRLPAAPIRDIQCSRSRRLLVLHLGACSQSCLPPPFMHLSRRSDALPLATALTDDILPGREYDRYPERHQVAARVTTSCARSAATAHLRARAPCHCSYAPIPVLAATARGSYHTARLGRLRKFTRRSRSMRTDGASVFYLA